ncbi:MAG TPA: four helix bundle protein [Chitinophagaceae bacterium]|nr:four helix bundle protein [Chitinophagaceae bacterium]
MNEERENIIVVKSYSFALEVIQLYKALVEKKEFVLSKQILRSGTSIGANVHEAVASESKRDFVHKLGIAVKEAKETSYWLNLLKDGQFITLNEFEKLDKSCSEIIKILNSIILTTKERYFSNS